MIYETKCLVNGKTYVGKHQTRDVNDGYVGSGKRLKRAIAKHGADNFVTRILYDFDVEWKMNLAEKILVCTDPEVSYNLCPGGEGGWGYVNASVPYHLRQKWRSLGGIASRGIRSKRHSELLRSDPEYRKSWISKRRKDTFTGQRHSIDALEKMRGPRPLSSGENNSQFGTRWVTDGVVSKKVRGAAPPGWRYGRII